jgi:HEAT repeat protein
MNEKITEIAMEWQSSDSARRRELIKEVVRTGSADGLKLLSQIFSRDPDIEIRQAARKAYNALYKYCHGAYPPSEEENVSPQEKMGRDGVWQMLCSEDVDQQIKALLVLQKQPDEGILQHLRENYANYHDPKVKATLVKTLGAGGNAGDVPVIYSFLQDENPRVRANAIEALESINHPNTYSIFIQWLSDSDNRVKANCIKALQRLGRENVNKILEDMLYSDYVAYKESALYVLSLQPSIPGLHLLQGFLSHEYDPALVERAVYIVYEFAQKNLPGAQEYLDAYYGTEHPEVEHSDGSVDSGPFEEQDLDSDDTDVLVRALSKVLENKWHQYAAAIVGILSRKRDEPNVVSFVIRILGEFGLSEYIAQIIPFLKADDHRTRANAVEALGTMGKNLDCLIPFLRDPNNRVRANAIVALKAGELVDVVPIVYDMIAHDDPLYRRSSIYAIKQLKNQDLLPALEHLVGDPDEMVSSQAMDCLQFYEICGITGATDVLMKFDTGQSLYEEYEYESYET